MQGVTCFIFAVCLSGCLAHPADLDSELALATTWGPDPFCPYPSEDIFFYTNPDDCSKYIECYEGVKYVRDCFDGLLWNEDALACDFPRNVDCKSRPLPTTPDSPVTNTGQPPTTEAPEASTTPTTTPSTVEPILTTFSPAHLCDNELDGTYLADPTDCKKFYECRSGKAIPGVCPTGTDWNEEILNCDRPENVKCN